MYFDLRNLNLPAKITGTIKTFLSEMDRITGQNASINYIVVLNRAVTCIKILETNYWIMGLEVYGYICNIKLFCHSGYRTSL